MKSRRSSSFSCGAWNIHSCISLHGIRNTTIYDNMMDLCIFLPLVYDSKLVYTTTDTGISYH